MTQTTKTKPAAKTAKRAAKTAKPAAKKMPAKKAPATRETSKTERTFHATAMLAAQAAKDTPKSAVLRVPSGFYTGSKRAGVKAGAEFIGRVGNVLAKPASAAKKAKQQPAA
jgi:hypothetical protein